MGLKLNSISKKRFQTLGISNANLTSYSKILYLNLGPITLSVPLQGYALELCPNNPKRSLLIYFGRSSAIN